MDPRLIKLLSQKPEMLIDFPEWMCPRSTFGELKTFDKVAIAEIAGRDSIAAVIRSTQIKSLEAIMLTIAYTGTEYGDWNIPYEKCAFLQQQLGDTNIKLYGPVFLGAPEFWHVLCGRYLTKFFQSFGFYTPCIGCHLYCHAIRVPLARKINCRILIGGEREQHDSTIKLNQIKESLNAYSAFLSEYGIDLFLPLRYVRTGKEIEKILSGPQWREGAEQMRCVLSKNYMDAEGMIKYDPDAIERFFKEYAFPVARKMLSPYV